MPSENTNTLSDTTNWPHANVKLCCSQRPGGVFALERPHLITKVHERRHTNHICTPVGTLQDKFISNSNTRCGGSFDVHCYVRALGFNPSAGEEEIEWKLKGKMHN